MILETIDLNKKYKNSDVIALQNLNLKIGSGEIYCMLGENGAGKTTLVNLIFNFISPTSGQILVNDTDVEKYPLQVKKNLSFVSENVMLYKNLSAVQNLDFFSRLAGKKNYSKDEYHSILDYVGLPLIAHKRRVGTFSKGMMQKVGIAIALAKQSEIIILDEPTSGLDPHSGREFLNILNDLRNKGQTIMMTSHDIFRAKSIADKVGILKGGKLVKEFNRKEITLLDLEKEYILFSEKAN